MFEGELHTFFGANDGSLYKIQTSGLRKLALKRKRKSTVNTEISERENMVLHSKMKVQDKMIVIEK